MSCCVDEQRGVTAVWLVPVQCTCACLTTLTHKHSQPRPGPKSSGDMKRLPRDWQKLKPPPPRWKRRTAAYVFVRAPVGRGLVLAHPLLTPAGCLRITHTHTHTHTHIHMCMHERMASCEKSASAERGSTKRNYAASGWLRRRNESAPLSLPPHSKQSGAWLGSAVPRR